MVLALVALPVIPRIAPADPVDRYVRAVVSEHARTLMWGARHGEVLPAALPWLTEQSGIGLSQVFVGDDRLTFVSAEPVYLERQRGVAIHYRDEDGHMVTYVALPGAGVTVPDRARVQVDRYRPALVRDSGFAAWVWKYGHGLGGRRRAVQGVLRPRAHQHRARSRLLTDGAAPRPASSSYQ